MTWQVGYSIDCSHRNRLFNHLSTFNKSDNPLGAGSSRQIEISVTNLQSTTLVAENYSLLITKNGHL